MSGGDDKDRQRVKRRVRVRVERIVPLQTRIRIFWRKKRRQVITMVLVLLVPLVIWLALVLVVGE